MVKYLVKGGCHELHHDDGPNWLHVTGHLGLGECREKTNRFFRVMTLVVATLAVGVTAITWMGTPTSAAQTVTVYKNPT